MRVKQANIHANLRAKGPVMIAWMFVLKHVLKAKTKQQISTRFPIAPVHYSFVRIHKIRRY
jgi:hypothetical protein